MKCLIIFFGVPILSLFFHLTAPPCIWAQSPDSGIVAVIKTALEQNPAVSGAKNEVAASMKDLSSEQYRRLPVLSVMAETEGSRESEALLRALQPLWVGGRIDNAIEKASVELNISKKELLRIQREVTEDTAVAYANLIGFQARIQAADKNIQEHQRLLELITRRKKGQISSGADVQLAKSRLSQAFLIKEELKGGQQQAVTELTALTLAPVPDLVEIPQELTALPLEDALESEAVNVSARLARAEFEVNKAMAERDLDKSELMPRVYGRLDQELYNHGSLSDQDLDTRLALVVEGSFEGAGFSLYERVKASEDRILSAKRRFESEENEVRRGIRSLLADRDMILELVELNKSLVSSTGETLASYLRQYEAGRKSWLDLLNIQQEHAGARLSQERVNSAHVQNSLKLAARTGRLDAVVEIVP